MNQASHGQKNYRYISVAEEATGAPGLSSQGALLWVSSAATYLTCGFKFTESDWRNSFSERADQIVHSRIGVPRRQRREIEPEFQELQDRNRFILVMINITVPRQR